MQIFSFHISTYTYKPWYPTDYLSNILTCEEPANVEPGRIVQLQRPRDGQQDPADQRGHGHGQHCPLSADHGHEESGGEGGHQGADGYEAAHPGGLVVGQGLGVAVLAGLEVGVLLAVLARDAWQGGGGPGQGQAEAVAAEGGWKWDDWVFP